jgi:hypothetical protein
MKKYYLVIFIFLYLLPFMYLYGYYTGSCKRNKKYICTKNFCLYKIFNIYLNTPIKKEIHLLLQNNKVKKRVNIGYDFLPESLFNCAIPNKKGVTIPTSILVNKAPKLIEYYNNKLCDLISHKLNLKLFPTDLKLPTSCSILIYEKEGDWINWHYDHNYYKGRFFTVLIPITNSLTCTKFEFVNNNTNRIESIDLINNTSICFEGNYLYHRASKLCKNQRRIILSCQYVTDNEMTDINKYRIKLKDFAYTGKLFNS